MKIRYHLIQFIIYNYHCNADQKFLTIIFDSQFNKQIIITHKIAYYACFLQIKILLNFMKFRKIIEFIRQHVDRKR